MMDLQSQMVWDRCAHLWGSAGCCARQASCRCSLRWWHESFDPATPADPNRGGSSRQEEQLQPFFSLNTFDVPSLFLNFGMVENHVFFPQKNGPEELIFSGPRKAPGLFLGRSAGNLPLPKSSFKGELAGGVRALNGPFFEAEIIASQSFWDKTMWVSRNHFQILWSCWKSTT